MAVIASLLAMRLPAFEPKAATPNIVSELVEGFRYVRDTPAIRFIISSLAIISLLTLPFTTLMPAYAKDVFHGTATAFGVLDGAIGLGGLAGALYLASLGPGADLNRVVTASAFLFGAGLLLFAYAPWYWLALAFLVVGAFGMMLQTTSNVTLLQTLVRPAMRGRVISLYVLVYTAAAPVGSLLVGAAAQRVGLRLTVLAEAVLALLIGLLYLRNLRKTAAPPVPAVA